MSSSFLPLGSRDLLPTDLIKQEKLRHIVMDTFKSWGYQPVLPPTIENLDILEKGRPQFVRETFKVIDRDGQLLALRPDITLPIARLAATRLSQVERPLRLCYTAKVFRQSPHLSDERREIYQAGIELIGCKSTDKVYSLGQINKANLECISILLEVLEKAGLTDYKIVLSHIDLWKYAGEIFHRVEEFLEVDLEAELDAILRKGDFIEYQKAIAQAEERCQKSLKASKEPSELKACFESSLQDTPLNYLKKACFELTGEPIKILDYLDHDSVIYKELLAIVSLEEIFGKDKFIIDFTMRPDPNYYTGLYFEVVIPNTGKAIGKGGRYDNLMSSFGQSEPAIGFSLQVDSLLRYAKPDKYNELVEDDKKMRIPTQDNNPEALIHSIKQSMSLRTKNPIVIID